MNKLSKIFTVVMPIYWALLTYMLLRPGVENHEYWFIFPGIDKVVHLSIFAVLGFCILAAFPRMKLHTYIYLILIYAFVTEILQDVMNVGRSAEFLDVVADTVGCAIGYLLYLKLNSLFKKYGSP